MFFTEHGLFFCQKTTQINENRNPAFTITFILIYK